MSEQKAEAKIPESDAVYAQVSFWQAFRYWLKLGSINFGGPAGQIALMHSDLVDRRKWISEDRFLQALNFCMLLPGPEAQQLAIYIGWLLHRSHMADRKNIASQRVCYIDDDHCPGCPISFQN